MTIRGAKLDLTQRAFAYQRGEITGVGTWLMFDGEYHPGMVLFRTGEEMKEVTRPYFISMDHAWIFDEKVGSVNEAAQHCLNIAEHLRMSIHDPATHRRIFSFIHDHLGDLLSMYRVPPARDPGHVIAEVTITNTETGQSREVEVRDV